MKKLPLPLRILKRLFLCVFGLLWIPFYHLIGLFPRNKNLWIFVSWFGTRYSDNSRIFFEWVNRNHPEIKAVWLSKSPDIVKIVRERGFKAYKNNSLQGILFQLRAGKLFSSTGGELSYRFTNGINHYALWHGMPLKKIGLDDKIGFNKGKGNQKLKRIYSRIMETLYPWKGGFWNYKKIMTVTNAEFFRPLLASAFGIDADKIISSGSPRCDALFENRKESFIEKIRDEFPNSKIIMYMPTFRTSEWTGEYFNPFSEKYGFDMEAFESVLERHKSVLVYKPHFYDAKTLEFLRLKRNNSRFFTVTDEDFDELYNCVGQMDILMTDYSSIYFDFIATKKPVILAPFDYEEYLTTARAHYFDYWTGMDGVKIKDWSEFANVIAEKSYLPVSEETRRKFAGYLDGNCCEKLWNMLLK